MKLLLGDIFDHFNQIDEGSIDLIIADPPFNLGKKYGKNQDNLKRHEYQDWCYKWLDECIRVLKESGHFYIMNIQDNIGFIQLYLQEKGLNFRNIIAWKNSSMPVKNRYCINYQPILYFTKSKDFTFNYQAENHISKAAIPYGRKNKANLMIDQWSDIPFVSGGCMASKEAIFQPGTKKKAHPCQMPIRLAERMIKFSTKENDIVLDPFFGSGTTAIACLNLNRQFIGIEAEEKYFQLTQERISIHQINKGNN